MNSRKAFVTNYKRKIAEIKADLAAPFDRVRLLVEHIHLSLSALKPNGSDFTLFSGQ